MYLIVGLGNPGKKYEKNFHNMGFLSVDRITDCLDIKLKKKECQALTGEAFISGIKIIVAKPQTFMNLSGESVKQLMSKYKIPPENLIVIYDDFDLMKGSIRIRDKGSSGTHNGMRNIISEINSTEFIRIRIGIKDDNIDIPIINYVLSDIKKDDYGLFNDVFDDVAKAALLLANGITVEKVKQKYNVTKHQI